MVFWNKTLQVATPLGNDTNGQTTKGLKDFVCTNIRIKISTVLVWMPLILSPIYTFQEPSQPFPNQYQKSVSTQSKTNFDAVQPSHQLFPKNWAPPWSLSALSFQQVFEMLSNFSFFFFVNPQTVQDVRLQLDCYIYAVSLQWTLILKNSLIISRVHWLAHTTCSPK